MLTNIIRNFLCFQNHMLSKVSLKDEIVVSECQNMLMISNHLTFSKWLTRRLCGKNSSMKENDERGEEHHPTRLSTEYINNFRGLRKMECARTKEDYSRKRHSEKNHIRLQESICSFKQKTFNEHEIHWYRDRETKCLLVLHWKSRYVLFQVIQTLTFFCFFWLIA